MKQSEVVKLLPLFKDKVDNPMTYAYALGYLQDKQRRGKKVIDGRALYKFNPTMRTTYKVILRNLQTMGFISVLRVPESGNSIYFEL